MKENCTLKPHTIENILKLFNTKKMQENMEEIRKNAAIKRKPHKNVHKIVNKYNLENPKKYKKIIRE